MAAVQYALVIGKPLTRHLTVRLEQQGIADTDAVKAIGRLITLLRDHVRKTTDGEIAYIWSREHGAVIGGHVHILLHLPAGYIWQGQRVQRWIERLSTRAYRKGTIKTTRVGRNAKAYEQNPGLYLANLATVVGYIMKGTGPDASAVLQLEKAQAQGRVIGKRCGMSLNIRSNRTPLQTRPLKGQFSSQLGIRQFARCLQQAAGVSKTL
ncbi:hypothetical protein [Sphingorhabdus sp.]|jgi:hypothetical protein|uniref:hypothetical protein n=1 Tax=Sphingorhabdus sp. TaxID=1902408 RepID=UPI003783E82D